MKQALTEEDRKEKRRKQPEGQLLAAVQKSETFGDSWKHLRSGNLDDGPKTAKVNNKKEEESGKSTAQ